MLASPGARADRTVRAMTGLVRAYGIVVGPAIVRFERLANRIVRLLGVDAPEKTGGYRQSEPFGDAATAFMKRLVEGQIVKLEYDGARKDQYNRTLAYVFLPDGRLANVEIIKAGFAETYRRFEYTRKPVFFAAEREAKDAKRGMWAARRAR